MGAGFFLVTLFFRGTGTCCEDKTFFRTLVHLDSEGDPHLFFVDLFFLGVHFFFLVLVFLGLFFTQPVGHRRRVRGLDVLHGAMMMMRMIYCLNTIPCSNNTCHIAGPQASVIKRLSALFTTFFVVFLSRRRLDCLGSPT